MTKFQSLKKKNDGLKSKLEALTKHFEALKKLLEKKESTDKIRQECRPSLLEIENTL